MMAKNERRDPSLRDFYTTGQVREQDSYQRMADRSNRQRMVTDNPVELSVEIIMGLERWMAVEIRELGDGGDSGDDETYTFDKFIRVLNRRCPDALRAMFDAGADVYV